ncbi:hypothetical protein [Microbacterium sp. BK668]|uniref:hypothetical protein n=1 Tax=Microbacterium sp. BK668 TaxID=2512118 RepID=UPI00105E8807|nr:hypothetical protein [Microbacterium sp. BK668]TDN90936.1 hypothetical protein EV279_0429 [Microbacterium sp. BK668]
MTTSARTSTSAADGATRRLRPPAVPNRPLRLRGPLTAADILSVQRLAGNRAATALADLLPVQRVGPVFTVTGLTAAGAAPLPGLADTYVAAGGTPVTVTATATSSTGAAVPTAAVSWSSGRPGGGLTRVVSRPSGKLRVHARAGASIRTVTLYFAAAPAPPGAAPAPALRHRLIGASNPGTDFGLTVVTIGDQGVRRPDYQVTPFFAGTAWSFGVTRVSHGFKLAIRSQGHRDVPSAAAVRSRDAARVIVDLTPTVATLGPPRATFWVRSFTQRHEEAHRDHFYLPAFGFWPASMQVFANNVWGTPVPFAPGTAERPSQARASRKAAWDADVATQHGVADAAEIGGSEAYAHGVVSNPLYVALVAAIRATVRPPAPLAVAAAGTTATSTTLSWTPGNPVIVTGVDVERRIGSGPWTVVAAGLAPASGGFTDATLATGTRYSFRVVALGAAGRSASAAVRVRTP